MPDTEIISVSGGPELEVVRGLFIEYGADVSRAYCLNGFDRELADLPGEYASPRGGLFLLRSGPDAAGCAGLRQLAGETAEMKRLYVRPEFQGRGFGRKLTETVVAQARGFGYRSLRLDTLGHMVAAQQLYRDLGFLDIAPYHSDSAPGMCFMELVL